MVAHDSFFGYLNLFKIGTRANTGVGERPPFPIIASDPTFRDIVNNLNRADFGFFCSILALSKQL